MPDLGGHDGHGALPAEPAALRRRPVPDLGGQRGAGGVANGVSDDVAEGVARGVFRVGAGGSGDGCCRWARAGLWRP